MRHLFLIFLVSCTPAHAEDAPEECSLVIDEMPILELKPIKMSGVISIDEMPPVEPSRRIIEVYAGRKMENGILSIAPCYVEQDDRSVDYTDCCPDGWQPLALGVDGLICEEL